MALLNLLRGDIITIMMETIFLCSLDTGLIGFVVFIFFIGQHNTESLPLLSQIYKKPKKPVLNKLTK